MSLRVIYIHVAILELYTLKMFRVNKVHVKTEKSKPVFNIKYDDISDKSSNNIIIAYHAFFLKVNTNGRYKT